jgi:ATP-dependent Lhr-like helicase
VEGALAELAAAGLATADSFAGLRALLVPPSLRPRAGDRRRRAAGPGMESAGRWSLLSEPGASVPDAVETVARALLRRYGVVLRAVAGREGALPPWRELLRAYRRLEARGEVRGGRFVSGFSGEQYALPGAVEALRAVRRSEATGELVAVSAADPANLVGVALPGERVPAVASNRVLFRDGVPVARKVGRDIAILVTAERDEQRRIERAMAPVVRGAEASGHAPGIAPQDVLPP